MEETFVKPTVVVGEEVIQLSTLDQQAQRNYANMLLVFQLQESYDVEESVQQLKYGLAAALSEIREFGSTVAPSPNSTKNELQLRLGPDSGVQMRIVRHDGAGTRFYGEASPISNKTFLDLQKNGFPFPIVANGFLFSPQPSCVDNGLQGVAALLVQLNIIQGGIILAIAWHHSVSDAKGMNTFCSSWAHHSQAFEKHRSASSTAFHINNGPPEQTRDRWRLTYGYRDVGIARFPGYKVDTGARNPFSYPLHILDHPHPDSISSTFSTWYFSRDALKSLRKSLANAAAGIGVEAMHFTNSEAVSALVWKHLSLARLLHQCDPGGVSLFSTRIDYRSRTKPIFDDGYIGNINEPNARAAMPLKVVCGFSPDSLAILATAIRAAVGVLDEDAMRGFIGLVEQLPAVTDLTWDYNTLPGPDLAVTDMSGLDMQRQDWGGALGKPVCVRSASREKGVAYFLPQDKDAGFEVQLQCESEALGRLRTDIAFTCYAQLKC